ncbi:MAG TPA: cache domain-containing protein [Reyranella sp.]|nr:cache domain-containing protein [Reyranella sp.]
MSDKFLHAQSARATYGLPSIRSYLMLLIAAVLVPMLAQVAVLAWYYGIACQQTIEAQRLDVANNLVYLVDRDIEATGGYLSGMASRRAFQVERMDVIERAANEALDRGFQALALFDPDGKVKFAAPANLQSAFAQAEDFGVPEIVGGRHLFVSNLLAFDSGRPSVYAVSVPIVIDGKVAFVLTGAMAPKRLQALFGEAGLRDAWTAGVVDRSGVILARSARPETFVGVVAQSPMVEAAHSGHHWGVFDVVSRDGIAIKNTFVRSKVTGWTAGVAVPSAIVNAPLWQSMLFMIGIGLGLTLIAILAASLVANRIVRAVHQLGRAAVAFAAGDVVPIHVSNTAHIEDISQALEAAATMANQRHARRR